MISTIATLLLLLAQAGAKVPALRGPVVVVMLKDGCPCARECRFGLNALAGACRGKIGFVGLLDGNAARAKALAREAELAFPIVPDPRLAQIHRLQGRAALDLRLIDARGGLVGSWNGLDRANVAALIDRIRATTGKTVEIDATPFTVLPKVGCAFRP